MFYLPSSINLWSGLSLESVGAVPSSISFNSQVKRLGMFVVKVKGEYEHT